MPKNINNNKLQLVFEIRSRYGRDLLFSFVQGLRNAVIAFPQYYTASNGYGITINSNTKLDLWVDDYTPDGNDPTWKEGEDSKVNLDFDIINFYPSSQYYRDWTWKRVTKDAEFVSTLDYSVKMIKRMFVTFLLKNAFTTLADPCKEYTDYGGARLNKIDIPFFHDYIEDDEHHIEDVDFMKLEINKTEKMGYTDFENYFKDDDQEKKLMIDCPTHPAYGHKRGKIIELIAFIYVIKGLPREMFIEKYGKFSRYWDKVTGGVKDVFLTTAVNDSNEEIQSLYRKLVKAWKDKVAAVQTDINALEKTIAEERKKFKETIEAEFERTVIDPIKQKQVDCLNKCKAEKDGVVQNIRTEIKKCKARMMEDVQKNVSIQKLLHISKDTLKIRRDEFTF